MAKSFAPAARVAPEPESAPAAAVSAPDAAAEPEWFAVGPPTVTAAVAAPEPPATKPVPAFYSVGVRNRCPWATVRSATTDWGRAPTILPADDPRLPELRRCEYLTVVEA
jgi:hypothetical protein